MEDERLEAAIRKLEQNRRDGDAWEVFYRVLYPFVFGSLFRSVRGNRYLAEECVQEVMMRVLKNFEFNQAVTPASVMTYLRHTMRSVVIDLTRQERKQPQFIELDEAEFSDPRFGGDSEAYLAMSIKFSQAMARLDKRDAVIVEMLVNGGSVADIEARLNISKTTAYRLIAEARMRLREILFGDYGKNDDRKRMS